MAPLAEAEAWVWLDGQVVPAAAARVPVLDRGFLYGDSVFEVTRTVGREPLLWQPHLDRLERSAMALDLPPPDRRRISDAATAAVAQVAAPECYLRVVYSRGDGPIDLDPASAGEPRLVVIAKPLRLPDARLYADGARLASVAERRNAPGHVPAWVKSSNYLSSVMALRSARRSRPGIHEALLCDLGGAVCEGASSNFFMARGGTLLTPPVDLGILVGITRQAVLDLCREAGIAVAEQRFPVDAIHTADEAFITSSIRGVLPVVELDGRPLGDGRPGPLTRRVMADYARRYLERKSSASPIRNSSSASPR